MSDKENQSPDATSPSFYPPEVDNVSQDKVPFVETVDDVFWADQYQLNQRGPFLDPEGRVAIRAFSHKDVVLLGFLIEETDDSFMVLLPAHLARDEMGVKATQVIPSPMARLLKTSINLMYMPTPVQLLYYLSLVKIQFPTCPGYFTKDRIGHIDNIVDILKLDLGVHKTTTLDGQTKTTKLADKSGSNIPEDTFSIPDHMIPRIQH